MRSLLTLGLSGTRSCPNCRTKLRWRKVPIHALGAVSCLLGFVIGFYCVLAYLRGAKIAALLPYIMGGVIISVLIGFIALLLVPMEEA